MRTPYSLSRRCFLRSTSMLSVSAVVACGIQATTITPAVAASITAIQGIIADVQGFIAAGSLTPAQLADAQTQIAALNAQITALNNAATTPSAAVDTVTAILAQIGQYLPLVLTILGMASPAVLARPDTPAQAQLRAHMAALRAAAGRSL